MTKIIDETETNIEKENSREESELYPLQADLLSLVGGGDEGAGVIIVPR